MPAQGHPYEAVLIQLYRAHFEDLRRYLAHKLNCPEAGRDAAQDVFLRLLVRPAPDAIANPRGFLFRSARNLAIDCLRAAAGRPVLVAIDEHGDELADACADPARIAEARQRLRALAEGIEILPARCREVFFRHRFEGQTQAEIAAELAISTQMVEKHLARALLHLRRRWPG
ncbi:RNA polymerase sigma factor [Parasulfuritortus cantonensis]|nr:RNA polymerase sigma factor [Parasulfuritortus cantonensis]